MQTNATIEIRRKSGLSGFSVTGWDVFIDNTSAGIIGNAENRTFSVEAGKHTIFLRGIRAPLASAKVTLHVLAGQTASLDCGTRWTYTWECIGEGIGVLVLCWFVVQALHLQLSVRDFGLFVLVCECLLGAVQVRIPGRCIFLTLKGRPE